MRFPNHLFHKGGAAKGGREDEDANDECSKGGREDQDANDECRSIATVDGTSKEGFQHTSQLKDADRVGEEGEKPLNEHEYR